MVFEKSILLKFCLNVSFFIFLFVLPHCFTYLTQTRHIHNNPVFCHPRLNRIHRVNQNDLTCSDRSMINTKIDANQVPQDPINRDSYKANFIVHKIPDYSKQQIKSSKRQYGLLQKSQINDLQYSLYVTWIVYHHR